MKIHILLALGAALALGVTTSCERESKETKSNEKGALGTADKEGEGRGAKTAAKTPKTGSQGLGKAGVGKGGGGTGTVGGAADGTTGQTHSKGDGDLATDGDGDDTAGGDPDSVRPPTAQDLAAYTADLKGKGPLMATIETTEGTLTCELYGDKVPMTVANFVGLARGLKPWRHPRTDKVHTGRPFYDGIIFHRVIEEFMIQTGDPLGKGVGGPGYRFADEFDPSLKHTKPGTMSMANSGKGTNGSQFFITEVPTSWLDNKHSVFGHCNEIDVVKRIARVPKDPSDPNGQTPASPVVIKKITISRGK